MTIIPTLIETIRLRGGVAPLWYLHLRRLSESCRALGVPLPLQFDVPAGGPDRVQRLEVGPKGMTVTERELPAIAPVTLVTAPAAHRPYPHKTTDRRVFDDAGAEARRRGADDALLLTQGGHVAECGVWSLFWWDRERVAGPPLTMGVLRSVSRLRIEEIAGPVADQTIGRAALAGRSLFVANAVRGVVSVTSLDGLVVPSDVQTEELSRRFWP
jgi:branched-subunit amino acid aminotransferase/4-amino-4-deoxychorismate lyase